MSDTIFDAKYLILLDASYVVRYFGDEQEAIDCYDLLKEDINYTYSLVKVLRRSDA